MKNHRVIPLMFCAVVQAASLSAQSADAASAPAPSAQSAIIAARTVTPNPAPPAPVEEVIVSRRSQDGPSLPVVSGGANPVFSGAAGKGASVPSVVNHLSTGSSEGDAGPSELAKERARLRLIGDFEYHFQDETAVNVVRAIAMHAGMRMITEIKPDDDVRVDVSQGTYNVLDLLDLLEKNYGLALNYERGIWRLSKAADAPFQRAYALRHNNREEVEITSPVINSIGSQGGANLQGQNSQTSQGQAGGNTSASFAIKYDGITKDIAEFIAANSKQKDGGFTAQVRFIPETNEVVVFGTAKQHEIAADYIAKIDQPVDQIEFTAFFVESASDPVRSVGLDWSHTLTADITGENSLPLSEWRLARGSILTAYEMSAALKLSATDSSSSVFQAPSVVGLPNRKTVLDATRQVPVAQSTFNAGGSTTPATSSSLQYIDVGTIVGIHYTTRKGDNGRKLIRMHVSLVVSSIIGETLISGNPAPVTSRRRFEFSAEVEEGQSLAVGGLVSNSSTLSASKTPGLGSVPVLGRLFRAETDKASRSTMTVYITPRILNGRNVLIGRGLPRVWPDDLRYNRVPFGDQNASSGAARHAIASLGRELDALAEFIKQGREPAQLAERIRDLSVEIGLLEDHVRKALANGESFDAGSLKQMREHTERIASMRREFRFSAKL